MPTNFLVTFFVACLITFSSVQVAGLEPFSGFVNKKLRNLLQCNIIAYYHLREDGPDPGSFLDFVGEPEQFYWFIEHYLSVPFRLPNHLKHKDVHNFTPCLNRSWVSEFLKKYEDPDITALMAYLDKEQRAYFTYTFEKLEPVGKYTSFPIKEFHKYCILPPLIETNIKKKNTGKLLSFQLNKDEYKIYLGSVGTPISALKNVFLNMPDGKRKEDLKIIIDNQDGNSIFVNCPIYYLNLHYKKECGSQPNILKCLDTYIRNSCLKTGYSAESASLCEHLGFLFDALSDEYSQNFAKFLSNDDLHLVKPQSVWGVPLFSTYKPKDYEDAQGNLPTSVFKVLNKKNRLFLSFFDQIPKSPYYVEENKRLLQLSEYASSIFDKLHRFFYIFKKHGSSINPVSVKELSHNIIDFKFKKSSNSIQCENVKNSLNLNLDVELVKGIAAEKICKVIEKYVLTTQPKEQTLKGRFKLQLDDVHKGFRTQCILLSTHVEAFNIVRQLLNLESVLSLTRYTSLYLHKFFKSITSLKGNFLYDHPNAIKYARSCGRAVLHVPAVLYRRNIYLAETFLSLYLGLSNLVSSNPTSPFFEYAIIEFLVTYFNKGSEKFILYFISIISVLQINSYYYEQLYCHHQDKFEALRSKIIHPSIVSTIIENVKVLISSPRYSKMKSLFTKFDTEDIFDKRKVFELVYNFDTYMNSSDAQERAKLQEISDDAIDLETTNDGIGYRKADVFFETNQQDSYDPTEDDSEEGANKKEQENASKFAHMVPDDENLSINDKNKELELELYKYIGSLDEKGLEPGTFKDEPYPPEAEPTKSTIQPVRPVSPSDEKNSDNAELKLELKKKKGKSPPAKLRKGVDFYESTPSLDQFGGEDISSTERPGTSSEGPYSFPPSRDSPRSPPSHNSPRSPGSHASQGSFSDDDGTSSEM
ncbi:high molecular weight rhoptry protein 3, putative [Plasmodium ovale]|uniref:High molecular weight rhoptry protein 3, putative n=1 Tax=Plasmodium ovale TaxID=36330 RepID=A0A1C3KQ81_PLAOA|nr:high molecular weight rhoptry protein 3, putative [Plasmodium ovale]